MTDPLLVACAKDAWTKVATNVLQCSIHIKKNGPTYWFIEVDNGSAAPTLDPELISSVALMMPYETLFQKIVQSDLYVYCKKAAGSVRVSY